MVRRLNCNHFSFQMYEESTRLQDIRQERLRELQTRHAQELAEFDAQATMASRSSSIYDSPRSSRASSIVSTNSQSSLSSMGSNRGSFSSRNGDVPERVSSRTGGSAPYGY